MYLLGFACIVLVSVTDHARHIANQTVLSVPLGRIHRHGPRTLQSLQKTFSRAGLRNGEPVTLIDVQDMYYYGLIEVGTPGQTINVDFDTGSSDLWVFSAALCRRMRRQCKHHNSYDNAKSKTFKKRGEWFSIDYGSGYATGKVAEDNLSIGGIPIIGQVFGQAIYVDSETTKMASDGILGMAYPSLSVMKTDPPFVTMVKQGVVDNPVFAFYLNKNEPSTESDSSQSVNSTAELVLGGVDPEHYTGEIVYTNVTDQSYWKISLSSIYFGSKKISGSVGAIPDSGTWLLVGPSSITDPINTQIGGKYNQGIYVVDCSTIGKLASAVFQIGETKYVFKPEEYIVKVQSESEDNEVICISGFAGFDEMPFFILGDVFMRKYYTVFDYGKNQVGFATAR